MGFAFATIAAAPCAYADAIDGEWCSAKGQSLKIEGPKIRIPSGLVIEGQYRRHSFAYEAPQDDLDHGQIVIMELLNEEQMRLARVKDGVASPAEDWRRCNVTS